MSDKLYDICYSAGKYMDQSGQEKTRYENVGAVMNGEYGPFIVINRALNLAGIPGDPNRASIILKLFKNEPSDRAQPYQDPAANNPANSPQTMGAPLGAPIVCGPSGAPVFNPNPPQNQGAGVANGEIPF